MKTFAQMVQEGAAGMNRKVIPKLKDTPKSVANKIRKDNPWHDGELLASAVEAGWDKIKEAAASSKSVSEFRSKIEEIPEIEAFCKKKHLAPSNVSNALLKWM